ncbi:MAG: hypothetical protein U5L96_04895 [Owenweeksia sp.]|nr:hypothetical protein [Owenweeksia sp.]
MPVNPFNLKINFIELENGRFVLDDYSCDSCIDFHLRNIDARITNFDLAGKYLTADIQWLSLQQEASFTLREFSSGFAYQAQKCPSLILILALLKAGLWAI